ncbi:MAG TPA: hypothetical protein VLJ37_02110 [bacterium]|nr:hypothetical protein [bacterium]
MLDKDRVLNAFAQALREPAVEKRTRTVRPRAIAVQAHRIYCENLSEGEKRPAAETFRKFATGKLAIPEIVRLLKAADVRVTLRASLNRRRVREVFREAIQRLETRLVKGRARPLQIARRAYEIYTRDADESASGGSSPSRYTFQRLIYGKTADPEILTLIATASKRKDGTA